MNVMISNNQSDENGVKTTPKCYYDHFQSVNSIHCVGELGLQGGKEIASYYLNLVKIISSQQNVSLNTRHCSLQRQKERAEIEEYILKHQ